MALLIAALLVTCHLPAVAGLSLVTAAFAGTHVTATYDLGANPRVMATVNGTPQYGLVFAQRNKRVTYGEVEYGPSVVKGYLNSSGQLNDGAGNLWLDLIPNLGATPGDSYYVVTFNIQGRVHAEIWVVPDVVSVAAEVCRQAQPPSSTAPALFYQFLQQAGDDLPQRQKLNFAGSGVSCVDNAGQLRTDCTFSGGSGGGSTPKASATVSGTVKTDVTASDPVVYLQSSTDSLLAGKVSATRNVSTSSPLTGGGPLSSDLTLSCPTCSVSGHSHAEGDVSNLVSDLAGKVPTSRTISTTAPLQGGGDLSANRTFYINLFGTAPGTKVVSTSLGGDPTTDNCVKWIAGGKLGDAGAACGSGGGSHNLLSSMHSDTTAASAVRGDGIFAIGATPTWQRVARPTATGGYFKWNGTDIVASTGAAAGAGSCTNQVVTATSADAAPTCTTVTSSYVDTSIAKTGADINTSNQVTATHLSSPLPAAQGGTGNAYFAVSGPTSTVKTFTFPNADATVEYQANKNAAGGYAGLTGSTKLNLSQMQEVMAAADLSDLSGLFGTAPGTKAVTTALAGDPTTDNCVKWIAGGKLGDAGAACGSGGSGITSLNTLTASSQMFATPGTSGTAPNWSSVTDTHTLNIPMAATSGVTAGLISKTQYDTFNGKPDLVASGTAGVGPSKAGTATTAARSDHDHRSVHALTWFFPGIPATGVQNFTLTFPDGSIANLAILDMRVTVNTTSASSSTLNIQRCTASCTGTSPTFANIYSANLTLSASTRTASKGSAPDQNVSGLAAGDQFKANLVTIGASLADVTVTMTCKYDTQN
jgi:hypothetical protein